jgi:hypothetical protein
VLLLPSDSSVGPGGNPFLNLSGLEQPASIVVAYFASATAKEDIANQAPSAEFDVEIDSSTRGPVIVVTVTDKNAEQTLATLNYITNQIPLQLQRLQQEVNAPSDAMITSMQLVIDNSAEADRAATIRMVIAPSVVGLAATAIAAFMIDGVLLTRKTRRSEPQIPSADAKPDGGNVPSDQLRADGRVRRARMGVSKNTDIQPPPRVAQIRPAPNPASARPRREN